MSWPPFGGIRANGPDQNTKQGREVASPIAAFPGIAPCGQGLGPTTPQPTKRFPDHCSLRLPLYSTTENPLPANGRNSGFCATIAIGRMAAVLGCVA